MTEETSQEPDRLPLRAILITAGITIATFAGSVVVAAEFARPSYNTPVAPPSDTLERTLVADTQRGVDLQESRAKSLDRYGWVDRDAGIARIPIDRAIDLTASEPATEQK
jgi:hypothetical protein